MGAPQPAPAKAPEPAKSQPKPNPQPKTPEQKAADFQASVDKAEADRAKAGGAANAVPGAPDIKPNEVPTEVKPGDSLSKISKTSGVPTGSTIGANPQIEKPDQIKPGQVVMTPTTDPKVTKTRTKVAEAEAADRKAADTATTLNAQKKNVRGEDRAALDKDIKAAQADADSKWADVEKSAQDEVREEGKKTTFPVDKNIQPAVDKIRARVPESAKYQEKVTSAVGAVDKEWRAERTTGAQMDELTAKAKAGDANVAAMEKKAGDASLPANERADAAERVKDAKLAAQNSWGEVRAAAGREIAYAGGPDKSAPAAAATADAIKGAAPGDAKAQAEIGKAYDDVAGGWRKEDAKAERGRLAAKVKSADARVADIDKNLSAPGSAPSSREATLLKARSAAQKDATTARAELQAAIARDVQEAAKGQAYPEEGAGLTALNEIKAESPADPAITEVADKAMADATDAWRQQGVTRDTLGKVVKEYDESKAADDALAKARASADPAEQAKVPELEKAAATQAEEAKAERQKQIQGAYDAAPEGTKDIAAITRAETISQLGPQEEPFLQGVDDGLAAVVVAPKVKAVGDAYAAGGAEQAAATLDAVTDPDKGIPPDLANRVVDGSMPTIEKIANDFGDKLPKTNLTTGRVPEHFNNILTGIARATDRASGALSGTGDQTVAKVAKAFAEPLDSKGSFGDPLRDVTATATDRSSSATLPVALARAMQDRGDKRGASTVLQGAKSGFEAIKDRAAAALDKFQEVSGPLVQARKDLEKLMTPEEADAATQKYLETHPDEVKDFNDAADALDAAGRDVQHAALTLDNDALATVGDVAGVGDLRATRDGIVNDPAIQAAINSSSSAKGDLLHHVTVAEALRAPAAMEANPGSLANATRGLSKELFQATMMAALSKPEVAAKINTQNVASLVNNLQGMDDKLRAGGTANLDPRRTSPVSGLMNAAGFTAGGFALHQTIEQINAGDESVISKFRAAYLGMGVAHQGAELSATLAAHGLAWKTGGAAPTGAFGKGVANYVATVLPKINPRLTPLPEGVLGPKELRTSLGGQLLDQPGWVRAATFIRAAGFAVDVASGWNAAANEDWLGAGLYGASAAGGLASIASGVGIGATALGPVGAGLMLAAGVGLTIKNEYEKRTQYQAPSKDFLIAAGVDPEKAEVLSDYDDSDGSPIGPAIAQAMENAGRDPRTFLQSVKTDPRFTVENLRKLQNAAMTIEKTTATSPAGEAIYFDKLPYDKRLKGGGYNPYAPSANRPAPAVQDLSDLRKFAQNLFGAPVLG